MSTLPSKFLARLNNLRSLQQQVAFWEQTGRDYKRACLIFQQYVDCIREFNDPKSLVNSYIRFASYCENMDDVLLSRSLLKEAVNLMHQFQVGTEIHLERVRQKIDQLRYYF